ncbi:hypothetical protein ACO0LO_03635 [Undibacterium sp. TJN25]|uniref:hypothetical protein n=1 Tax=Undibacterium sp. TJN25 TaxID=3413056 RepID=UPI003BF2BFDF
MKKLARFFLLCMLMLAIPLQGIAAGTMLFCGAGHHQMAADVAGVANVEYAAMAMPQGHEHHHHAAASAGNASDHHQSFAAAAKDKCSSCAACCVGAVLLTAFADPTLSRPSSEKIDLIFSSSAGHISDSLERPPRA